ncbi:glycosyl hydrolase family 2 [Stackebrandtia endophytica]|uniref:Glycosyl hydrolase family 2 n=1 Tax=Stackebrandtia endophytica TaxID=1496996 RepID=A0A543ATS0_9ACTN|nr:sugar-binding domain-containing protein [Stackebrandtia endophytica]TQL75993.1 glycosyl hydrolase family 2 [Stackebrandtia endophytica]
MTELLTRWGAQLDPEEILPEYPRPQLVRDSYLNLNGRWDYVITPAEVTEPDRFDGTILVPFSPEAPLSGVDRQLLPDQRLWYRRTFELPPGFRRDRVLLHFGAVDESCQVFLNGSSVGSHSGGYWPFHCDITDALEDGVNTILVAVRDSTDTDGHAHGKQRLERGGIWYTAQSGIWQTVWLESVPTSHITSLSVTPHLDDESIEITVYSSGAEERAQITIRDGEEIVATARINSGQPTMIPLARPRMWSPEDPHLYDLTVQLGDDEVGSYFGMRSFGIGEDDAGVPRILLNGRPYFHAGVLDQGYWPDGLYTAPSDAAMIHDIATMKDLGYTMLRKHIKIEPLRWYYHCDRLGMLVWQDLVNGGGPADPQVAKVPRGAHLDDTDLERFGRADRGNRKEFRRQLRQTVALLRNVVSLAVWVPFNEGWGQFEAAAITEELAGLDPTRLIDQASGWHDQGGGDFRSIHVYIDRFETPTDEDARILALTEYGGYSLRIDGHLWGEETFGYRGYETLEQLGDAFRSLHTEQIIPAIPEGLSATVYTQLSDVEDEINGLLSYDRAVTKPTAQLIREVNRRLRL